MALLRTEPVLKPTDMFQSPTQLACSESSPSVSSSMPVTRLGIQRPAEMDKYLCCPSGHQLVRHDATASMFIHLRLKVLRMSVRMFCTCRCTCTRVRVRMDMSGAGAMYVDVCMHHI